MDASDPYNSLLWFRSGFLMFCRRRAEFAVSDCMDGRGVSPRWRGGWHAVGVKMIINSGRAAMHAADLWSAASVVFACR